MNAHYTRNNPTPTTIPSSIRRRLNSMNIRLLAARIRALPKQHLLIQLPITQRPALAFSPNRQQIPIVQRKVTSRLHGRKKLQFNIGLDDGRVVDEWAADAVGAVGIGL
jgi:hypothetical protein